MQSVKYSTKIFIINQTIAIIPYVKVAQWQILATDQEDVGSRQACVLESWHVKCKNMHFCMLTSANNYVNFN